MEETTNFSIKDIAEYFTSKGINMQKSIIFFYEREGLIKPDKIIGNFRPMHIYNRDRIIERIYKILELKKEGYKLSAIKEKLDK